MVRLTPRGWKTFEEMAIEHRQWVSDMLDGLDVVEQQQLIDLLSKLRDALHYRQEHEA